MSADSAVIELIHKWISEIFASHCYRKIDVYLTGTSEKGEGYVGNIAFVKVHGESYNGLKTSYDLVIKYGKMCEKLRNDLPIKMANDREIFVYEQAMKVFQNLEKERNVDIINQFMTECFGTLSKANQVVIILQNLKTTGYQLHDALKPLDFNHLTITMENYGKHHAFSFALRQQKPEEFRRLFEGMPCVFKLWIDEFTNWFLKSEKMVYEILDHCGEVDLLDRLRRRLSKNVVNLLLEVIDVKKDKTVLIHGDCWNNNIMFKYHDSKPVACKFLDFQNSFITSPIFDLSYHLFATASEAEFQQFDHLLKIYHQSLCQTLKQLGTNEEVFTYDELICHWKNYSIYGFIQGLLALTLTLSNKEDALDLVDFNGEKCDEFIDNLKNKNFDRFSSRIVTAVKYFLNLELCY